MSRLQNFAVAGLLFAAVSFANWGLASAAEISPGRIPVIFATDLFHPHDDPDDHFDLATVFAIPELDLKAILLDLGNQQKERPGRVPIEQIFKLAGRKAPYAIGLGAKLKDPGDLGLEQPPEEQGAIKLLMEVLRKAREPVTIISVGSARQITAAFNRDPALLRSKVKRIYASIGNIGTDQLEWNVQLDPQAYVGLLRSGLPIYLMPCMKNDDPHATYWQFKQAEVLETAPEPLQNFFIYALQRVRPDELDPMAALGQNLKPWHHLVWAMPRNMWSTLAFLDAAGRKIYKSEQGYAAPPAAPPDAKPAEVYSFIPARVEIDDKAKATFDLKPAKPNIQLSHIPDRGRYTEAMRDCIKQLFAEFPLSVEVGGKVKVSR